MVEPHYINEIRRNNEVIVKKWDKKLEKIEKNIGKMKQKIGKMKQKVEKMNEEFRFTMDQREKVQKDLHEKLNEEILKWKKKK